MSEGNGSTDPIERKANGTFARGHRGYGGRPKGARNRLTERFLDDLQKVWKRRGVRCLEKLSDDDPATLARVVSQVLPKELLVDAHLGVQVEHRLFDDAQNFAQAFRIARGYIGGEVPPMIEGKLGEDSDA